MVSAAFVILVWADRRFRLGHGRVVALYIMIYTLGRGWIEMLRIDDVELDNVGGLRFNVWTSLILFVAALVWFVISARRQPGREAQVYAEGRGPDADETPATAPETDVASTTADADRDGPHRPTEHRQGRSPGVRSRTRGRSTAAQVIICPFCQGQCRPLPAESAPLIRWRWPDNVVGSARR